MQAWETHYGTLTLDAVEGYVEAEAIFQITTSYDDAGIIRGRGWRSGECHACRIEEWTFNGLTQTRETAIALLGEDEVKRQEAAAGADWQDAFANGWAA